MSGKCIITIA